MVVIAIVGHYFAYYQGSFRYRGLLLALWDIISQIIRGKNNSVQIKYCQDVRTNNWTDRRFHIFKLFSRESLMGMMMLLR